ncbi:MAG: hypothetical protein J7555_09285 [Chloroflexi bacterium]|nr:hypothetical protein [Chloroflexota bacterium]
MREPVIRFSLVFLLSPLCAMVGGPLFGESGLRLGWLLTFGLITGFGLWSVQQIWQKRAALPRPEWAFLESKVMLGIGILSIVAALIALALLFSWLTALF